MIQRLLWRFRYYKKWLWIYFYYYSSKIQNRKFFEADIEGVKVKLGFSHPYQHLMARHLSRGKHESNLLALWKRESEKLEPGSAVLDIGGYNGVYGLLSALVTPDSEIFIFEPDKINTAEIRNNCALNNLKNVAIVALAISDKTGKAFFREHPGGTGGGY